MLVQSSWNKAKFSIHSQDKILTMYSKLKDYLIEELQSIEDAGLYKNERVITSSQDAVIKISTGQEVINFCANNYLGLSNNPEVIQAAKDEIGRAHV